MRIVTVVGARPEFLKAAPPSLQLQKDQKDFLVHTGPHYNDMSTVYFRELEISESDVHLGLRFVSNGEQTATVLYGINRIPQEQKRDAVIVYSDRRTSPRRQLQ